MYSIALSIFRQSPWQQLQDQETINIELPARSCNSEPAASVLLLPSANILSITLVSETATSGGEEITSKCSGSRSRCRIVAAHDDCTERVQANSSTAGSRLRLDQGIFYPGIIT